MESFLYIMGSAGSKSTREEWPLACLQAPASLYFFLSVLPRCCCKLTREFPFRAYHGARDLDPL